MKQFIPFEDDWDALANLRPENLVPYRMGMLVAGRVNAAMGGFTPIRLKPAGECAMTEWSSGNGPDPSLPCIERSPTNEQIGCSRSVAA